MNQHAYILLLLLLVTYQFMVQATDSTSILPREDAPSNCVDSCSKRTMFNIVWGCISTTLVCAWTAIHPNIPPREGPLKGTLRRLELMFWAIMAPEILPAWALNQRLAAMTVRDVYNEGKGYTQDGFWKTLKGWVSLYEIKGVVNPAWTLKHGHFLIMGGIHLIEPVDTQENLTSSAATETERLANSPEAEEGRHTILTLEMIRELVKDPEFKISLTEAEIADRSKGDALSKIIFTLQSSWFILQCLARRIQGLTLTQLELTTLALASLNGITFLLWWDKPLGAKTLMKVYMKRKLTDVERNVGQRGHSYRSKLFQDIRDGFEDCLTTIHDILLRRRRSEVVTWLIELPYSIIYVLFFPIIAFSAALFYTIHDLVDKSTSFPADATQVPTFYVPKHKYSEAYHIFILLTLGTLFGGIHCAGWDLPFPTYPEQKLWRVASLGVTIIPFAAFPFTIIIFVIAAVFFKIFTSNSSTDFDNTVLTLTFVTSIFAYAGARLILLGQAIALLRHLPPGAFTAVDWIKFYPHFL